MWQPHVDQRVRLTHDIPELALYRGDVGVVRSVWFAPACAYEVEFEHHEQDAHCQTRALVLEEQLSEEADELAAV